MLMAIHRETLAGGCGETSRPIDRRGARALSRGQQLWHQNDGQGQGRWQCLYMASECSNEFSASDTQFTPLKLLKPMNNVSPCSLRVYGERATRQ